jgi:hypothetical protein
MEEPVTAERTPQKKFTAKGMLEPYLDSTRAADNIFFENRESNIMNRTKSM